MEPDEPVAGRDWNALLEKVLEPFRSEAAAFRVLMVVVAVFAVLIALVYLVRAIA
jgi:uncharacterized membrane protein